MFKNKQLNQAISLWKEDVVTSTLFRVLREEKVSIERLLLSNALRKKECVELSQEYNHVLGKLHIINMILDSSFIHEEEDDERDNSRDDDGV